MRCREFYLKWKKNPNFTKCKDADIITKHIEYMDKHFPNWLDSIESYDLALAQKATRVLIPMEKKPIHEPILQEIKCLGYKPTTLDVKQIVHKHRTQDKINKLEMPEDVYEVIVVDPPWSSGQNPDADHARGVPTYMVADFAAIEALDIPAAPDSVLWLWAVNSMMHEAYHVLDAWGFTPKTVLTWVKDRMGTGYWLRGKSEQCILAIKGSPIWKNKKETTILNAPIREHSRKPDEFYDLVNEICTGRKIDMFSREKRDGWDQWGDEVDKF